MHESARRGLRRLGAGVALLALFVTLTVLLARGCRSDEERLSDVVDEAHEALMDRDRDAFLSYFAPEVRYRADRDRADLERDLDRWIAQRGLRVTILERRIVLAGDEATIDLRCDVGNLLQTYLQIDARLLAVRTEDGWKVTALDWGTGPDRRK